MIDTQLNELDHIRINKGSDQLVLSWKKIYQHENEKAIGLINDLTLTFPTFFLLSNEVNAEELSIRNQLAIHHIHNTLKGTDRGIVEDKHFTDQHHEVIDSFHWMIKTGGLSLLNPAYIQVIDQAFIQVLLSYREDLTKEIIETIFFRHRYQVHRHYLMWGLFEASEPKHLIYICSYLYSSSKRDQELARKLLHFIPKINDIINPNKAYQYSHFWLLENLNYLVKSGETNDMNPAPILFYVDQCAKYLGVIISSTTGKVISKMSQFEIKRCHEFRSNLTYKQQEKLARASLKRRLLNPSEWNNWLHHPLDDQQNDLRRKKQ